MSRVKELGVAAIDFGTTYSGYAFNFGINMAGNIGHMEN